MATFLFSLVLILASVAALAVGVLVRGRPLAGSCGGHGDGQSCSCGRSGDCEYVP